MICKSNNNSYYPHLNAVESAADAVAVDPNLIKTLLPNDLITFFINGKPVFSDGPRTLEILLTESF